MKFRTIAAVALLLCTFSRAEDPQKTPAVANTRLQIFFTELETQWLKAIQDKDPAALNRIVADEFLVTTSAPPGNSIRREQWFLEISSRRLLSFQIKQLAVREISPTIAVVSFVQTDTYQQSVTPQKEEHFIVDVWINSGSGDNWRCTGRYFSELKSGALKK